MMSLTCPERAAASTMQIVASTGCGSWIAVAALTTPDFGITRSFAVSPSPMIFVSTSRSKGNRRSPTSVEANPIEEYVQGKLARAKKTRRAASDLSQAMRVMSAASSARPPVGPPTTVTVAALTAVGPSEPETEGVAAPRGPTRPRKLTIGTGQVFQSDVRGRQHVA